MGLVGRFLFNDASWHGQCHSIDEFKNCIRFCIDIHSILKRYGLGLEVGYGFLRRPVGFVSTVQEALALLDSDQRTRLRLWLDKHGPFWDRPQRHSADEYFECKGHLVTDTALAEAAHLAFGGGTLYVVSLQNSNFADRNLRVTWHEGPAGTISVDVGNIVTLTAAQDIARQCEPDFTSYAALIQWTHRECRNLAIVRRDILGQLGTNFVPAVAKRGRELLGALNEIAEALKKDDINKYKQLCSDWLTSERFSDSSKTEKDDRIFSLRMRFKHPCTGEYVWCYWHGKVRTGVFRLHFEWPPPFKGRRLFIAYFGPKLTKK